MSDQDAVLYNVSNHVATITVNRPEYRNAQSRIVLERLDELFKTAGESEDVHVIVLFGAGDHFSAGHDLGSPMELADRESRPMQPGIRGRFDHSREQYVDKTMRWRNVPKPTIAGVQGYCIYGGWIVASAMDIVFAAESAMFLASNFQYFSLPWDVHTRRAKELLFESRFLDANEAKELGFVNRVFPDVEMKSAVLDYAEKIARNDPFQLRMMKLAINHMQDAQGFQSHVTAAHLMHILSTEGEKDPDFALASPDKRRPMVERAFENYRGSSKKKDR